MKKALILLATIVASTACYAQELSSSDSWTGELASGMAKLKIGFTINTASDGEQVCTMDVPEQGMKNFPVELVRYDADSLEILISVLGANYKGKKVSSESIEGVFVQQGFSFPLNLKRGAIELNRPQTPEPPFEYTTEEVVFRNEAEGAELSGTLTYPVNFEENAKSSVPVVLMVSGSGLQDRNEEAFGHKPFLVIADFLAKNGIASLRYDDRGFAKSTGPVEGTTTENNRADAEAGISYLRSLNKFGKVGVLGHSEGGTIAFMMGADKSVDFLISLAGAAAKGIDVLVGQNETLMQIQGFPQKMTSDYVKALRIIFEDRINGKEISDQSKYIEEIYRTNELALPDELKTNLERMITSGGQWITWFLAYDPAEDISKITCPVMAVNGNLDLQVLSKDNLPVIKENLPKKRKNLVKEYESLNHFFQHCTDATALGYGSIEETISEEVLNDIVKWIKTIK